MRIRLLRKVIIPLTKQGEELLYPTDAFESMCASLFLSDNDLVAMLKAYFDESYNHRSPKRPGEPLVFTVACWLAPVQQWKRFGKKWKHAVRNAQQYLKRTNQIQFDGKRWSLAAP